MGGSIGSTPVIDQPKVKRVSTWERLEDLRQHSLQPDRITPYPLTCAHCGRPPDNDHAGAAVGSEITLTCYHCHHVTTTHIGPGGAALKVDHGLSPLYARNREKKRELDDSSRHS